MPSAGPLLQLIHVTRRYESPDSAEPLTVLDRISLELARGESLAIVGPSGSGKSTLLHIIGTLDRATSGEVHLAGRDLNSLDEEGVAEVRNSEIGFVFQAHYLLPQCTVLENVLVPTLARPERGHPRPLRGPSAQVSHAAAGDGRAPVTESAEARATRLLTRIGLGQRFSHRPGQLSGGERQRVAVVRALINRPQLLLADEPTGSLDQASARELARLLLELNREEGVALIVVTHSRDLAQRMGRVLELRNGRLQ